MEILTTELNSVTLFWEQVFFLSLYFVYCYLCMHFCSLQEFHANLFNMYLLLLLVCAISVQIGAPAYEIPASDCHQVQISNHFAIPATPTCQIRAPSYFLPLGYRRLAILKKERYVTIPVLKCQLQWIATIANCTHSQPRTIESKEWPNTRLLTDKECVTAYSTGTIQLTNQIYYDGISPFGHTVIHQWPIYGSRRTFGDCQYDRPFAYAGRQYHGQMVWDITIYISLNNRTFNTELDRLTHLGEFCTLQDQVCYHNGYTLVPYKVSPKQLCPYTVVYRLDFNVTAPQRSRYIHNPSQLQRRMLTSIKDNKVLYLLTHQDIILCGQPIASTNYPNYFIAHEEIAKDFRNATQTNTMFHTSSFEPSYSHANTHPNTLREIYYTIQAESCDQQRKIWQQNYGIMQQLPTGQPALLATRPAVFGVTAGELLYFLKCRTVLVTYRKAKQCYTQLPIYYHGKQQCLDPRTRIIQETCTPTSCNPALTPGMSTINGVWFTYARSIRLISIPQPLPLTMSWNDVQWRDITNSTQTTYNRDIQDILRLFHQANRIRTINNIIAQHTTLTNHSTMTINTDIHAITFNRYHTPIAKILFWITLLGDYLSPFIIIYSLFALIAYIFNRITDFMVFRHLLPKRQLLLLLCCPPMARFKTARAAHHNHLLRHHVETCPPQIFPLGHFHTPLLETLPTIPYSPLISPLIPTTQLYDYTYSTNWDEHYFPEATVEYEDNFTMV